MKKETEGSFFLSFEIDSIEQKNRVKMKKTLLFLIILELTVFCSANEIRQTWNADAANSYIGLSSSPGVQAVKEASPLKTPDGDAAMRVTVSRPGKSEIAAQLLYFAMPQALNEPGDYELSFLGRAAKTCSFRIAVGLAETPWTELSARYVDLDSKWQRIILSFRVDKTPMPGCHLPRMMIGKLDAPIDLGPMVLRKVPPRVSYTAGNEWLFCPDVPPNAKFSVDTVPADVKLEKVAFQNGVFYISDRFSRIKTSQEFWFYNEFDAPSAGQVEVGAGADWFFEIYCNGKLAYSTMKEGNRSQNFTPSAFLFPVTVRAGKNLFAVRVRAGSNGAAFACGPAGAREKMVIRPNAEWKPIAPAKRPQAGSILDFSNQGLQDAPAGKYGRVVMRNGRFSFENAPEKNARFYGVNLFFDINAPAKEYADLLVDVLAATGYNTVRLHHYDYVITGVKDNPGRDLLLPEAMDRMDYLFAALKKRGFYMTMDLHTLRTLASGFKGSPDDPGTQPNYFYYPFVTNLMNHVNPYTGIAWKDDPALISICPFNENAPMFFYGIGGAVLDIIGKRLEKRADWKNASPEEKKYIFEDEVLKADKEYQPVTYRFLKKLGVRPLLTDQNVWSGVAMALIRDDQEFVDNHFYWDHPNPGPNGGSVISNHAATKTFVGSDSAFFLPGPFAARLLGKPYTVTEFNFCYPNQFRGEMGPLTGAYAALQGWDALYEFGFGTLQQLTGEGIPGAFDNLPDPIRVLSSRLGVLLFLRGDVATADKTVPLIVPENYLSSRGEYRKQGAGSGGVYPTEQASLGFVCRIGSVVERNGKTPLSPELAKHALRVTDELPLAETLRRAGIDDSLLSLKERVARSCTGELELNSRHGYFRVQTPRTEILVFTAKGERQAKRLAVVNRSDAATVAFSALDGKNLADSGRIIGMHLTNALASEAVFADKSGSVLEKDGHAPVLVRRGVADVRLQLAPGAEPTVYAVALNGVRQGKVPSRFAPDGTLTFTADTFRFAEPCLVYEIVR